LNFFWQAPGGLMLALATLRETYPARAAGRGPPGLLIALEFLSINDRPASCSPGQMRYDCTPQPDQKPA
jgi:hypothetical protein